MYSMYPDIFQAVGLLFAHRVPCEAYHDLPTDVIRSLLLVLPRTHSHGTLSTGARCVQ